MGKKNFFAQGKYRVRWKNNAVFSLEKTVLDRIPLYNRTVLKEECLYKHIYLNVLPWLHPKYMRQNPYPRRKPENHSSRL